MKSVAFIIALVLTAFAGPIPMAEAKGLCARILSRLYWRYDVEVPVVKIRNQQSCPNCSLHTGVEFYENFHYAKTGHQMPLSLSWIYLDWLAFQANLQLNMIKNNMAEDPLYRRGLSLKSGLQRAFFHAHFVPETSFQSPWKGREPQLLDELDAILNDFRNETERSSKFKAYQTRLLKLIWGDEVEFSFQKDQDLLPYKFVQLMPSPRERSGQYLTGWEQELWGNLDLSELLEGKIENKDKLVTIPHRREFGPDEIDRAIIESLERGVSVPISIVWDEKFIDKKTGRISAPPELAKIKNLGFAQVAPVRKLYKPDSDSPHDNHAILIVGVKVKKGRILRLKLQNSHGEEKGDDGFFHMDAGYFHTFLNEALIPFVHNEAQ